MQGPPARAVAELPCPRALQGTSVTELDERVKALDRKLAEELQALWPLRVRVAAAGTVASVHCVVGNWMALLFHSTSKQTN